MAEELDRKPGTHANESGRRMHAPRVLYACLSVLIPLWVFLVLYPNPVRLVVSVQRLADPKVDPAAVETLAAGLPSDAAVIEKAVLDAVPYRYDWEVYAMPWYFPTVDEVLEKGQGDCKARAVVLASLLEAKGIPYRINSSPTHVWVDYAGKAENSLENSEAGLYEVDPQTGARSLHLPQVNLTEFLETFWEGFWPPMPVVRKTLLVTGPVILLAIGIIWPMMRGKATGDSPHCTSLGSFRPNRKE